MKKMTSYAATATGGMAMMITAVIIMFLYSQILSLPAEHLGFLALAMVAVPFMAPVALIFALLGFIFFLIGMLLVFLKGK